ncbi:MAG: bis(5'-nucleosyl)-tetraphosphatase (symmetrical) YqeK [Firmicutes bacterium]|nr:bis(5'-nucleosyl)-tetraphosphatase (symmetrical) YqeK [[Eubacterium] siraeum]MCM1488514.1 bis(5'-nucleosyl)-tetraphosphatase (symmetrical) YqeK [Bacillota bacterium]
MNKDLKKYEDTIKPLMGSKRFKHSVNVADMCVKLAKKFGEDEDKAYTAGILHDCRKEIDKDLMLKEAKDSGFYIDPVELNTAKLWHGIAAAYYVKNVLKIEDTDILNAIRFHTVGRADMSKLEKIVYLADMVSEERDYTDAEKYRAAVMKSLDNGMFLTMRWSIMKTVGLGNTVPVCTLEGYNFYSRYKNDNDFVFRK